MKAKCLNPNTAWICGTIRSKADGVISPHMVFSPSKALQYYRNIFGDNVVAIEAMRRNEISVPCGKCAACQIRKRKEWTTRLTNEASCFDGNCCFITLTYNDDNVPTTCFNPLNGSMPKMMDRGVDALPLQTLLVADVQKFVKRLRSYLGYVPKIEKNRRGRDHVAMPIRYYVCGEYGSKYRRPHYHLLIFGWKPSDMVHFDVHNGHPIYRSAQIEKLWKFGFSTVEPVEGGVAKYCSRYVTKKFARLQDADPFKDCVFPEFVLQSVRDGGIGATWFDRNLESCLGKGYIDLQVNGKSYFKAAIPAYYWRRARSRRLCLWLQLRNERMQLLARGSPRVSVAELVRSVQKYEYEEHIASQRELF